MRIYMKKQGTGAPTYNITADTTSVAEGNDIVLTLNTTSVRNGTEFELFFSGTNIDGTDFADGLLTNIVTVNSNQAILTKTIASSLADLDLETFTVQVKRRRGEVVAESTGINILGETFSITASAYTFVEGAGLTFTVSAPNTGDGVALDIAFSGTGITASDFQDATLTNSVTVNNGTATLIKYAAEDGVLEGTETFTAQVKNPSNGQVLATISTNITLLNTVPVGEALFTSTGTRTWTAPSNVTSVSVVAVGGGGGGGWQWSSGGSGGGGLGWKNNIAVTPGQTYTVVVGSGGQSLANSHNAGSEGGNSYFNSIGTVAGYGSGRGGPGSNSPTPAYGGGFVGDGGGVGGDGAYHGGWTSGGAGAGGYTGHGASTSTPNPNGVSAPPGGGGAGGGYYGTTYGIPAGGGVGIYGQGASGLAAGRYLGGGGGSGGEQGTGGEGSGQSSYRGITGGKYGGGGGGSGTVYGGGFGGHGTVRIVWGDNRSFPTSSVDQSSSEGNIFNY